MPKDNIDIDFEIQFYEGVVKQKPDFVEALSALGELYTQKGLYDKGLSVDKKLSILKPEDPIILYNLACSYSLVNEIDASLDTMKRAIGHGYKDFQFLQKDNDLDNLRKDGRFQDFFNSMIKKKAAEDA